MYLFLKQFSNVAVSGNIEISKQAPGHQDNQGFGSTHFGNTQLSFDKDKKGELMKADLNRSGEHKKDRIKLEVPGMNTTQINIKKNTNKTSHQLDLENLNQSKYFLSFY
jgi:hypothetical protein